MKKNDPDGEERLKFDFPSRELGFYGVPFKVGESCGFCVVSLFKEIYYQSNVLLQPTAQDCLVHLVEGPPFFVLALGEKKDTGERKNADSFSLFSGCGSGVV